MHLLVAIEGDAHSEQTLRLGIQLARDVRCKVTILTVAERESDRPQAEAVLAEALALIDSEPVDLASKVIVGETAAQILAEAEAGQYDLLIIGMHPPHSFLKRLQGLVSEQIMAHAPCATLIVKGETRSIHNILVCSSGAAAYEGPTRSMVRLAPIFSNVSITLLHVMSQISATPDVREGWQLQATADELMEEESPEGRVLEQRIKTLEKSGFRVTARVRHGLVVDEILEESSSGNYDLVVIGGHSTTGWKRYLLDDVTHQLITRLDRPVLVV